ncbi:MAG TPA: glutamine synthetase family protein [Bryobacteraceae bacterium]|nr:glutamine synthetase family protein [Bryobacteraceae bacterium]
MLEQVRELFGKHGIQRVKLGAFDIDCTLRGKYISLDKFWTAAEAGVGFCDVIFGWDIADVLYDNAKVTGWHTGFPDATTRIDLASFRPIPWEPGTAFFLLDFVNVAAIAPRQVLQRVIGTAGGYRASFSAEYEFFFFRETPESLREKHYRGLTPLSPGAFGYSVLRASENQQLALDLFEQLAGFGIPLEGLHTETGPGVYEAAIAVDDALAAADKAALFKTAVKEIASRHGVTPTFMAKWSADLPGSSGHLHQSLWDAEGRRNLFSDGAGGMSAVMRHYIGGLVANLPDLAAVFCPTVNSYKRTVPGAWAPINATWGVDNRTTAIRAIPGGAKSTRVELRLTGADINPYLAMAASLAAGLDGVERESPPPAPVVNAYCGEATPLPRTLADATARFRSSQVARRWLGDEFVEHYAGTREWESRQFDKAVTDWELARYFESI